MNRDTIGGATLGAKSDNAFGPLTGSYIGTAKPAISAVIDAAVLEFNLLHPGPKPTRAEASLHAGASLIVSEVIGFDFEKIAIFESILGWGTSLTYQKGFDWNNPGDFFTNVELRADIMLKVSGSIARALFGGHDLLSGNPEMIGIACMVNRLAHMSEHNYNTLLFDALAHSAQVLEFHRANVQAAAQIIERNLQVTRSTSGIATLLAAARAVPIPEMPPAIKQARELYCLFATARVDLAAVAHEVARLAKEDSA